MLKKGQWIRNKRHASASGICFEPLEPRLLLSGSWAAGIDSPAPDVSPGTQSDFAGAQLHFRRVSAQFQCMACFTKYEPAEGEILCPSCGSTGAKILAGEEFYMEAVDVE